MDPQVLPQLSLGTAALVIFAICVLFSLLRGMLRMILGTLTLAAAAYVAYCVWLRSPSWLAGMPGGQIPWVTWVLPAVAGLFTLFLLRSILSFATKPFRREGSDGVPRSPMRRGMSLLVSLVPTAVLWFGGLSAVRHAGSVDEIRDFAEGRRGSFTRVSPDPAESAQQPAEAPRPSYLVSLKSAIDHWLPSGWLRRVDPFSDDSRVALAKLIALAASHATLKDLEEAAPPKAIPVMEEPEIRDLILNDPGLLQLARERRYAEILRDPRLDRIIENPDLRELLRNVR